MYAEYGKEVEFLIVYIREAHPTDGRVSGGNTRAGINFKQPKTLDERKKVALEMCSELKIKIPAIIDKLDDKVGQDYSGMPDRLYLIGDDGKVVFKGDRGPFGFKPAELEKEIILTLLGG
jgi:hypothetical protein